MYNVLAIENCQPDAMISLGRILLFTNMSCSEKSTKSKGRKVSVCSTNLKKKRKEYTKSEKKEMLQIENQGIRQRQDREKITNIDVSMCTLQFTAQTHRI